MNMSLIFLHAMERQVCSNTTDIKFKLYSIKHTDLISQVFITYIISLPNRIHFSPLFLLLCLMDHFMLCLMNHLESS